MYLIKSLGIIDKKEKDTGGCYVRFKQQEERRKNNFIWAYNDCRTGNDISWCFSGNLFSGYTRGAAKSKQEATAPVEDQVFARETGADEYILPDSEIRYLNEYDITGWSVDEIRLAKNEIYARHGRIFEDEDLDQYFRSKTWYIPSIEPEDFQTDVFNEYEKKNVEYLADAQIGKNCFTSDTFTYQDSLGEVTFAFKYPVYWSKKVMFRVSLADSGMVIHCVDVLNNKRGLSLYGDNFGTVFLLKYRQKRRMSGMERN